jgi:monofunctional biosynthetic peptidoglycan transglycosylase
MARPASVSNRRPSSSLRRWLRRLVLGFAVLSVLTTILLRFVPPPVTPLMVIRGLEGMAAGKGFVIRKNWQPLNRISPAMVRAVIAAEDQKFVHHFGFDVDSISKAYVNNRDGGRRKGGSTITQQTAKNIFLWPGGSYLRKGIEAYFTLLLELFWNKERIIEVYLNIAELGPGVYGVESAARIYYHTSARRLTARQAAMLAAILPAPRQWSPARPTGYLVHRQRWILQQMRNLGPLSLN